jgi:hypothetical protein
VHDRWGEFGADGHDWTAELRPKPATYPGDLTQNLRISLLKGYRVLGHCQWQAGPFIYEKPLGGHIHFGTPITDGIRDTLDHLMAPMLALVEPAEGARLRRNTVFIGRGGHTNNRGHPYGLLGDFKTKDWGFEYRTPSSFIVTPGITTALIALTKALVFEEQINGCGRWAALSGSIRQKLRFTPEDFYSCERTVFLQKLGTLWPIIHNLKYFQKGMEGRPLWSTMKYLLQVIEKEGFAILPDLKTSWKITATAAARVAGEEAQQRTNFTDQLDPTTGRNSRFTTEALQARYVQYLRQQDGMVVQDLTNQERFRMIDGVLLPEDINPQEATLNTRFQNLWNNPPDEPETPLWDAPSVWRW